jgi:hypothetical protein
MGARDLLHDLADAGLTINADGTRLVIRPASKLTEDMRAAVLDAKPELLAFLGADPRFNARRERLLRWGWNAADAEAMAERLIRRDREADDRVSCAADCKHYRPGRCGNHRAADLSTPDVGRDLAALLQRCGGFEEPTDASTL